MIEAETETREPAERVEVHAQNGAAGDDAAARAVGDDAAARAVGDDAAERAAGDDAAERAEDGEAPASVEQAGAPALSWPTDTETLARRLAAGGRDALLERLKRAYAAAAATHADIISLSAERVESMARAAVVRADGLQWRCALADAATREFGMSLTDALAHPAVARAQELVGAPSYEASLAELMARPVPPPLPNTVTTTAPTPERGEATQEFDAVDSDHTQADRSATPPQAATEPAAPEPAGPDPAATEAAPEAAGPDPAAAEAAPEAAAPVATPAKTASTPAVSGSPEQDASDPDRSARTAVVGAPTEVMEALPADASQDNTAEKRGAPKRQGAAAKQDDGEKPDDGEERDDGDEPDASEPDGGYLPVDDELRVTAYHLGGVANLPSGRNGLDLRLSEYGLDILEPAGEIIGRLHWNEIDKLEVSATRSRLRRQPRGGSRILVRTKQGDATFEIPELSSEQLQERVTPLVTRFGANPG